MKNGKNTPENYVNKSSKLFSKIHEIIYVPLFTDVKPIKVIFTKDLKVFCMKHKDSQLIYVSYSMFQKLNALSIKLHIFTTIRTNFKQ